MVPSKRNRTSAADGRSHKKHDPTEISLSGKGPGRQPNREAPPGKSDRPEKQRRSVATAANSYLSKIKSWVSHLAIKSGELINFQTARILLLSMISTAIATPLAWVNKLPVMTPVFQAVHEVTKVSVSATWEVVRIQQSRFCEFPAFRKLPWGEWYIKRIHFLRRCQKRNKKLVFRAPYESRFFSWSCS